MLIGYNTNGFAHHDLIGAIEILAEIGYESVAITLDHHALNPYSTLLTDQLLQVAACLRRHDMRCVIEARPAGQQPVSGSHQGATLDQALKGSAKKLEGLLNDTKERLEHPKGNTSFAGEQTT